MPSNDEEADWSSWLSSSAELVSPGCRWSAQGASWLLLTSRAPEILTSYNRNSSEARIDSDQSVKNWVFVLIGLDEGLEYESNRHPQTATDYLWLTCSNWFSQLNPSVEAFEHLCKLLPPIHFLAKAHIVTVQRGSKLKIESNIHFNVSMKYK